MFDFNFQEQHGRVLLAHATAAAHSGVTARSVLLAVAHWSYTRPQAQVAEDQLCKCFRCGNHSTARPYAQRARVPTLPTLQAPWPKQDLGVCDREDLKDPKEPQN
jgi:hypothetical protein